MWGVAWGHGRGHEGGGIGVVKESRGREEGGKEGREGRETERTREKKSEEERGRKREKEIREES